MRISELKQLKVGDRVRWNDPDEGACSKDLTIKAISVYASNEAFIESECGSEIECYARELQALPAPGAWTPQPGGVAKLELGLDEQTRGNLERFLRGSDSRK